MGDYSEQLMAEVRDALEARGASLVDTESKALNQVHSGPNIGPRLIGAKLHELLASAALAKPGNRLWHHGRGTSVLLIRMMPSSAAPGLVLCVAFDRLAESERHQAERRYEASESMIRGYFRLLELEVGHARRTRVLESAINMSDTGVMLLTSRGTISFANAAAEALLADGDGLRRVGSSLRAATLAESVKLQLALEHVASAEAPASQAPIFVLSRKQGPPLIACLMPAEGDGASDAAIMYVVDPRVDNSLLAPLCQLYRLSPVETGLVCHLVAGQPLDAAAKAMRIKVQTARGYLKQIFIKTATSRQTELVVLMLSSVLRMRRSVMQQPLSL